MENKISTEAQLIMFIKDDDRFENEISFKEGDIVAFMGYLYKKDLIYLAEKIEYDWFIQRRNEYNSRKSLIEIVFKINPPKK